MLKNLGRSKLSVGLIGQGSGFDFSRKISSKKLEKILRMGVDLGMNFIDTGELYGEGLSEEIVGRAIKGIRGKVIIATKFAPQNSDRKNLISACNRSLKRLRCEIIDLYQFHWP